MNKFVEEHYKSIIVAVISTLIAALLLWLSREYAQKSLKKVLDILLAKYDIPLYRLIVVFAIGLLIPILRTKLKSSRSKYRNYSRDEVNGLVWEWSNYVYPRHFKPLCPKCLAELPIGNISQTKYICISCGFQKYCAFGHDAMKKIVKIEVEKRERTSDWKNAEKRIAYAKK